MNKTGITRTYNYVFDKHQQVMREGNVFTESIVEIVDKTKEWRMILKIDFA